MPVFFSLDPNFFKTHARSCTIQNGTTVYSNHSIPDDCSCVSGIPADPDFAGPGMMASFIFMSWFTIAVAAVPAWYSIRGAWRRSRRRGRRGKWRRWRAFLAEVLEVHVVREGGGAEASEMGAADALDRRKEVEAEAEREKAEEAKGEVKGEENVGSELTVSTEGGENRQDTLADVEKARSREAPSTTTTTTTTTTEDIQRGSRFLLIAKSLLVSLTDIQAITGLAIILTGLSQLPKITFYHEQFASNLWWLTLNSLWVSRIDYNENSPYMSTLRMQVRRLTITTSVICSAVFQLIIALREENQWDPLKQGKCYVRDALGSDFGQNMFWFLGTCLYGLILALGCTTPTRRWFDEQVLGRVEPSLHALGTWMRESHEAWKKHSRDLDAGGSSSQSSSLSSKLRHSGTSFFLCARTSSYALALGTWWCTIQFLSIWSSGTGSHLLEMFVYSIFAAANTWWVIALKVDNVHLVVGNESKWTFAQTLPVCLVVLVVFYLFDAVERIPGPGAKGREEQDEEERGGR